MIERADVKMITPDLRDVLRGIHRRIKRRLKRWKQRERCAARLRPLGTPYAYRKPALFRVSGAPEAAILQNSLFAGNLTVETGSTATASATTQSSDI
jgi:hypothetical protein